MLACHKPVPRGVASFGTSAGGRTSQGPLKSLANSTEILPDLKSKVGKFLETVRAA